MPHSILGLVRKRIPTLTCAVGIRHTYHASRALVIVLRAGFVGEPEKPGSVLDFARGKGSGLLMRT